MVYAVVRTAKLLSFNKIRKRVKIYTVSKIFSGWLRTEDDHLFTLRSTSFRDCVVHNFSQPKKKTNDPRIIQVDSKT